MSNRGIIPDINEMLALRLHANNIKLFNQHNSSSVQVGNKSSHARGRGMEFEEVRKYQPGDDVRLIHWPMTARLGKAYTKVYREERERSVYLVIDQSKTMRFGTKVCFKSVIAANIAAVIGWAALNHHEQVGAIIFNEKTSQLIKPKRNRQTLLNIFSYLNNSLLKSQMAGGLLNSTEYIARTIRSGNLVIIISDYSTLNQEVEKHLQLINQKCEIINLLVYDPLELKLPGAGTFIFTEDGQTELEITSNSKNNQLYTENFTRRSERLKEFSHKNNMQFVQISTSDDIIQKLNQGILKYGY